MAEQTPETAARVALTFDETEAMYAALIQHGDFQEDCDDHSEFDCRSGVYAAVERILGARLTDFAQRERPVIKVDLTNDESKWLLNSAVAEAFRAGYAHAQAEEEADQPIPVPSHYRLTEEADRG